MSVHADALSSQETSIAISEGQQFFNDHVKNVLDNRCVACHACYDSPCGLNLASTDGISRGMATSGAYLLRARSSTMTRLFTDAESTREWREKKFFSIFGSDLAEREFSLRTISTSVTPVFKNTLNHYSEEKSILKAVLALKEKNPAIEHEYTGEPDVCPVGFDEDINKLRIIDISAEAIETHLKENKFGGMPYGFPALEHSDDSSHDKKYGDILNTWLETYGGALPHRETEIVLPYAAQEWEKLLNTDEAESYNNTFKRTLTAKYIYEHLFLAHIYFTEGAKSFYKLVRSSTEAPHAIKEIATRRPSDSPFEAFPSSQEKKFFYRFRKITSTAVSKTHIVLKLDTEMRHYIQDNFLAIDWIKDGKNQFLGYGQYPISEIFLKKVAENPFHGFAPIPPSSRYVFLLNNAEYFIRTFIRGPACRGQSALNVINDQSWVTFLAPEVDPTIQNVEFLYNHRENLKFPSSRGRVSTLINAAIPARYIKHANTFNKERIALIAKIRGTGLLTSDFWRGNDNAMLTVYRHGDSATVMKGLRGGVPKTAWMIDYPTFETIYYNLVVNFDLYSSTMRQAITRKYMELSRLYSEDLFLNIFPENQRKSMRMFWMRDNIGETKGKLKHETLPFQHVDNVDENFGFSIEEPEKITIKENRAAIIGMFNKIRNDMSVENKSWTQLDTINCIHKKCFEQQPKLDKFETQAQKFRQKTIGSAMLKGFPELTFIRVTDENDIGIAWYTMIKNTGHTNVASMFNENARLDPSLDSVEFHQGFIGNYPNLFLSLREGEEDHFFKSLTNKNLEHGAKAWSINPFTIGRFHQNFWNIYDEINLAHKGPAPWGIGFKAGLFDLNRYMNVFNKNVLTIHAEL